MMEHRDGCVCERRSSELREAIIARIDFYMHGRDDRWPLFDATVIEEGAITRAPTGSHLDTEIGGIVVGPVRINPFTLRLTESQQYGYGISDGVVTRFVVRMFFETDVELYKEVAFTARVIAATASTARFKPLTRPEAYRFCVFEGDGEQPPG